MLRQVCSEFVEGRIWYFAILFILAWCPPSLFETVNLLIVAAVPAGPPAGAPLPPSLSAVTSDGSFPWTFRVNRDPADTFDAVTLSILPFF